jgi:hypothetical protein
LTALAKRERTKQKKSVSPFIIRRFDVCQKHGHGQP